MHLESRALSHEIETQIETLTGDRHRESDRLRSLTVRRLRRLATPRIAEGTQAADQNYQEMRAVTVKEEPVNQVQDKPRGQNCHQCGYPGHLGNSRRHKEKISRNYYRKGHLARVCPNAPREQGPKKKPQSIPKLRPR